MTETDVQAAKPEEPKAEVENSENENSPALSASEAAIIRQLEYYFGDANLAKDKFMKDQITKDEGWVPLDVLLTFKRLKSLSEDKKVIVDAISKSEEGLIEVSEDREKLRRHPERPLPEMNEETRKEIYTRTVYVKGFAAQDGTKMDELVEFFQPYEKVVNIVMRRYFDKPTKKYLFKGSVFVTFATVEQCETFLKEKLAYKGKDLICKMQNDYFAAKQEEEKERKQKVEERKRKKEEAKTAATSHLPTGASVSFEGTGADTTRESIKEQILTVDDTLAVAFIDYQKGDKAGHVRFTEADAGKRFVGKLTENKLKIDENEVTFEVLEGDKESEYLKKVVQDQQARRKGGNAKGKGGRGNRGNNNRHHGGGHNKRQRDNGNDGGDDEPPVKKTDTAAAVKEEGAKEKPATEEKSSPAKSEVKAE
ncbi:la protein homolog [Anopheles ziemanni]|uniref:la protein homolog n=1 Tax=Anopheles coustani TaxID=139045 RepID=UPI0026589265|nr:la protein homolog [Anopheles coustani]XP_058166862.1 la protein homolog [Anopheles ziemanni]